MSCVVTFTIFPLDPQNKESLAPYVARALRIIKDSGLPYELGAMGTVMEGEFDEVMDVVRRCHDELRKDCDRVYMTMAVDSKKSDGGRMIQKVKSVGDILE